VKIAEDNFQHVIAIPYLVVMMAGSQLTTMLRNATSMFSKVDGSVIFADMRETITSNIICFALDVVVTDNARHQPLVGWMEFVI
jgi:hypothetical protein